LSSNIDTVFKYLINITNVIVFVYNIPQVYKTVKTKKAGDLSFWFLFLRLISSIIWIVYSIYYQLYEVSITWILTGGSSAILLYYKYKYRNNQAVYPTNNLTVNNG
jgi:MtN3 and saliva related transmembrane protein